MRIQDIKPGMRVIPKSSTHPRGIPFESLFEKKWSGSIMWKGYLIVCDINEGVPVGLPPENTVRCAPDGRKCNWGHQSRYRWLNFRPQDLELVSKNSAYFMKYKQEK